MKSYVFEYDFAMNMIPTKGTLTFFEDGSIICECGGQRLEMRAAEIKEALVKAGVGCGLLYVKMADESNDRVLCRFTMSALIKAGDFCKIVNFYIKTGNIAIPDKVEPRVCPTCGRPLIEELKVCVFCYNQMGVLKRALSYLKPYLKNIALAEVILLVSYVFFLSIPVLNRYLIDNHLRPQLGPPQRIFLLAAAMLVSRGLYECMFIFSSRIFNRASMRYCNDLRTTAYKKLQTLSMNSFSKRTPGDLIRRIMEDTNTIRDFVTDGGRFVIEMVFMFVVVLVILLLTNAKLTLLLFLPVPFVMAFLSNFWKIIRNRYERQWRKNSKCSSILHDIIKGIRTVKAFGNEDAEIKKFAKANHDLATISSDNEALWARLFPLLTFFTGIGEILILYFGGNAVLGGEISLGVLMQFTMYIAYIYSPLRWMVMLPRWLADATTSMVKLFEIMDEEPEIYETGNQRKVPISGEVKFENVSFGYKSYEPVLKGIELTINPGEMIVLVGKAGVGKSTLINLVMRLYDPNIGRISINGVDIRDIPPNYLHESIGVVFQDPFLFAGSYYDNIAYAKPDATTEEIIAAAKAANAHDFIVQTADGYNTLIGEGGQSLSGGERQRLSIARAIIKNPDILILDEATSSLDVETEAVIQESLGRLVKGRTTIAIAHRLSTLRHADRLVVLDEGAVAEVGTHIELLRKKGIYYKLVMAQRQSSKLAETVA
jgi:ATP-binding cassette subfamily B protein